MKTEWLGITMLINDKSQLKRNVEQIRFQLALETSKSTYQLVKLMLYVMFLYLENTLSLVRTSDDAPTQNSLPQINSVFILHSDTQTLTDTDRVHSNTQTNAPILTTVTKTK